MEAQFIGINSTKDLPNPTLYAAALTGEFADWAYCEDRTASFRGNWRKDVFDVDGEHPMDLEIGTGNGFHFAHYASENPERKFIGMELKYKPLFQSIRRALHSGATNMRMSRYHANHLDRVFEDGELNNVIIHHPDPWPKKRQWKRRLIQDDFLALLYKKQRPGTWVEFKTDDRPYFDWAVERFERSEYEVESLSYDLHNSEWAEQNFETAFEKIFLKKGQPIHWIFLRKK